VGNASPDFRDIHLRRGGLSAKQPAREKVVIFSFVAVVFWNEASPREFIGRLGVLTKRRI